MVIPAVENTLSNGADVAGMAKYFSANFDRSGKLLCFRCHQFNGSVKLPSGFLVGI
jgi:hypothetical protein